MRTLKLDHQDNLMVGMTDALLFLFGEENVQNIIELANRFAAVRDQAYQQGFNAGFGEACDRETEAQGYKQYIGLTKDELEQLTDDIASTEADVRAFVDRIEIYEGDSGDETEYDNEDETQCDCEYCRWDRDDEEVEDLT
jgi:hypothetical protein